MYCVIHNVFWNYINSWVCPICALDSIKQIEEVLLTSVELNRIKSDEGDNDE